MEGLTSGSRVAVICLCGIGNRFATAGTAGFVDYLIGGFSREMKVCQQIAMNGLLSVDGAADRSNTARPSKEKVVKLAQIALSIHWSQKLTYGCHKAIWVSDTFWCTP